MSTIQESLLPVEQLPFMPPSKRGQSHYDKYNLLYPRASLKEDGKFAFDPVLGIEEIINRRVGENEIQTIETMRSYIDAQEEYASADHDGDGVLEYAQKIVSSPGEKDG